MSQPMPAVEHEIVPARVVKLQTADQQITLVAQVGTVYEVDAKLLGKFRMWNGERRAPYDAVMVPVAGKDSGRMDSWLPIECLVRLDGKPWPTL